MLLPRSPSVAYAPAVPSGLRRVAPHGVDLGLLGAALDRLACAGTFLDCGHEAEAGMEIGAVLRAMSEFRANLDLCGGGPLTAQLDDLCEYVGRRLPQAQRESCLDPLLEVSHLLHEVRAAWGTLCHV